MVHNSTIRKKLWVIFCGHLEVFSFNDRALGFYAKYGFVKTDKPAQMWKDKLPFIEMVRPADE